MSPTKGPVRDIKVRVPRHNGQRIGPTFTAHVEALAKKQKKRVDIRQTAYDSSSIFAQAIESASEWNSLLLTARADRGPQWDIGTQQFHVDEYSDLYYDPTPLREHEKEAGDTDKTEQRPSMPPPDQIMSDASPQMRRNPSTMSTSSGSVPFSPRHPGSYPPQGMNYNNMPRIPPGQFYGNGEPGMPSPMRMGSIGGMGMPMGDMGMGGMPGGNMGVGGMGPMGMGSPDVRRSLRRNTSMSEEGFGMGGMH